MFDECPWLAEDEDLAALSMVCTSHLSHPASHLLLLPSHLLFLTSSLATPPQTMVTLKDLIASEEELSKKPLLQRLSARLKQGVASGAARAGKRLLPDAVVDLLHYFTILFNGRAHNLTYYGAPVRSWARSASPGWVMTRWTTRASQGSIARRCASRRRSSATCASAARSDARMPIVTVSVASSSVEA